MSETGWQRTRAAALLGITRATLHAKLKRYDIKAPDRSEETVKPDSPAASPAELQESAIWPVPASWQRADVRATTCRNIRRQ